MNSKLTLRELPQQTVYGLHIASGDRTQSRDIPALAGRFHKATGTAPGSVLPFYVVSRDYDPESGSFTLFVGGSCGPEREILPAGTYAVLPIRPRFSFLWGAAVSAAKRRFYRNWLPESDYESLNLEYELHTEAGRRPAGELRFRIRRKLP